MASVTELQKLLVRLVGDNRQYIKTLNQAERGTANFVRDSQGRFRNLKGEFVSAQEVIRQEVGLTLAKLQAYKARLKEIGTATQKFGKKTASIGTKLSTRITAPLVTIGSLAAKSFGDYEESLDQIRTLVGVSTPEIQEFDKAIKSTASATGKGPKELAEAMFFITSAGLRGQEALDALDASAKAAAVGLGNTSSVADAVTSAMNAYGADTLSASRATDVLAAAVRAGKLDAESLAPTLGKLLPTASALKISFEDVAASIAVMSRTGLNAAEASTSVSSILSLLSKPPTAEGAKLLKSAQIEMSDLRRIAAGPGGLVEVMRLLDSSFKGNDEALAQIIPNIQAFRGVMNVLSQDASTVDDVFNELQNSVGLTQEAFDAGADGIKRNWNQVIAEAANLWLEIGELAAPAISQMIDSIKSVIQWIRGFDDSTKTIIATIAIFAAAIGPVLIALGGLISAGGHIVTFISYALIPAITLLGKALLFLAANPVGLVITAVVAAGAALAYFMGWLGETKDETQDTAKEIEKSMKKIQKEVNNTSKVEVPKIEIPVTPVADKESEKAAKSAAKKIKRFADRLKTNLATGGENGPRQQLQKLQMELQREGQSLTSEEKRQLEILIQQTEEMEKQKKAAKERENQQKQAAKRAQSLIDSSATPMQKLKEQITEIVSLHNQGLLTGDQARKAQYNALKDFTDGQDKSSGARVLSAREAGTREDFEARAQAKAALRSLEVQEEQKRLLKTLADNTNPDNVVYQLTSAGFN